MSHPDDNKKIVDPIEHAPHVRIWLWAGVGIFALAILFIWGFNTKLFIENTTFGDRDTNLLERGKQDFDDTIRLLNESDNTEEYIQEQERLRVEAQQKTPTAEVQKDEEKHEAQLDTLTDSILDLVKEDNVATTTTSTE